VAQGPLSVKWFGAKGDGISDDLFPFIYAMMSSPAGGQILVPRPAAYYVLNVPKNEGVGLDVAKSLTWRGEPGTKIKIGPEAPIRNHIFFGVYDAGITLRCEHLEIEGPDNKNNQTIIAFYVFPTRHPGTAKISLDSLTSTKCSQFLQTVATPVASPIEVEMRHCDVSTDTGLQGFYLTGKCILSASHCKFQNTFASTDMNSWGYIFDVDESSDFVFDDCEFSRGGGFGIASHHSLDNGIPRYAIIRNCRFTGRFANDTLGALYPIESCARVEEVISGCVFLGCDKAIRVQGDLRVDNCTFAGPTPTANSTAPPRATPTPTPTVLPTPTPIPLTVQTALEVASPKRNDEAGTTVRIEACSFTNALINYARTVSTGSRSQWDIRQCRFHSTASCSGCGVINALHANSHLTVADCIFEGTNGPTSPFIQCYVGNIEIRGNRFYNLGEVAAIRSDLYDDSASLTASENWFQNSSNAFGVGFGTVGQINIRPRAGVSPHDLVAGATLGLDWNYDTYVLSGTGVTATVLMPADNFNIWAQANIGPITIIPNLNSTWSIEGTGNVRADSGARTPERGVKLATIPRLASGTAAPIWVEIK
jgi:hypothetical protein